MYTMPLSHLCGVTREGLVLVSLESVSRLELDLPFEEKVRMPELFRSGFDAEAFRGFGIDQPQAERLIGQLLTEGLIQEGKRGFKRLPDRVMPLGEAAVRLMGGITIPRLVVTAEELLVLPEASELASLKRSVRAFIANIEPEERLHAYGFCVANETVTVAGDLPDGTTLAEGLQVAAGLDGEEVHVIHLPTASVTSVEPSKVLRGWRNQSRLGIVQYTVADHNERSEQLGMHICGSKYACPNLLFAENHKDASCKGIAATPAEAELIARAEATERFISGEVAGREFRFETEGGLSGQVCRPDSLIRFNDRQYQEHEHLLQYDPSSRYHWMEGATLSGSPCWVPAELTLFPFPGSSLAPSNSSGIAAHTSFSEAVQRAAMETIERDAYMWSWLQRVSRERIDQSTLPAEFGSWLDLLKTAGFEIEFINLTLETFPVVLCAVYTDRTLILGNGCAYDVVAAAGKALREAGSVLWGGVHFEPEAELCIEEIASATEHQKVYTDSPFVAEASFLYSSARTVDLQSIRSPLSDLQQVRSVASEPVVVDLTLPESEGLYVVRVFIPDFLPITFGYDSEPYGMPRAGKPLKIDGRILGQEIDLSDSDPRTPHPFA